MDYGRISVIIPAYEPDEKLISAVGELKKRGFSDFIIVNDGSGKEYYRFFDEAVKLCGGTYLRHQVNKGKGAALKTAFNYLIEHRPDSLGAVSVDSDGQHLPDDVANCVDDMLKDGSHIVFGYRDFSLPEVPERSRKGNNITRRVFKTFFGINLYDTQTGLRVFPASCYKAMTEVEGDRYEYENKMIVAIRDLKIPFSQVKISTVYIDENKSSHFRPVFDSLRIYYSILPDFVKYLASSLICVLAENILQLLLHDYVSYELAAKGFVWTAVSELINLLPARFLSSMLNYWLNKKFVFKGKSGRGTGAMRRYYILWIAQALVTALLISGLEIVFGGTSGIAYFGIECLVKTAIFFASYAAQKNWVFKKRG